MKIFVLDTSSKAASAAVWEAAEAASAAEVSAATDFVKIELEIIKKCPLKKARHI